MIERVRSRRPKIRDDGSNQMSDKQPSKGYVQVYTGDGKGKTTAALGLALRASGHGMRTYIGQFMKGQHYGELDALRDNPYITIEQYGDVRCIRREEVTPEHVAQAHQGLERAREAMLGLREQYNIVVLDEVNVAIWFGLLAVEEVLAFLDQRPEDVEVILTGRRAPQELIELADLVTEMREVKHYYQQGVMARRGIER
jgi:cob(I)alamin adenosyltransferase